MKKEEFEPINIGISDRVELLSTGKPRAEKPGWHPFYAYSDAAKQVYEALEACNSEREGLLKGQNYRRDCLDGEGAYPIQGQLGILYRSTRDNPEARQAVNDLVYDIIMTSPGAAFRLAWIDKGPEKDGVVSRFLLDDANKDRFLEVLEFVANDGVDCIVACGWAASTWRALKGEPSGRSRETAEQQRQMVETMRWSLRPTVPEERTILELMDVLENEDRPGLDAVLAKRAEMAPEPAEVRGRAAANVVNVRGMGWTVNADAMPTTARAVGPNSPSRSIP